MNILKFYSYIFYRFKNYYEMWQAVMAFNAVFMLNVLSIAMLYASIKHLSSNEVWFLYSTNDYFYDRIVLGVAKVSPIFLITFLISVIFKKKLQKYYTEFKNESEKRKKRRAFGMWAYFVFTVLFFIFSVVSSLFFN